MQKRRTLSATFHRVGIKGVLDLILQKAKMTWRTGEVWELGKFLGQPSEIVRLEGCRFSIDRKSVPANVIDLLLSHRYEQPEREALKLFLNPELPIIEFGACIGVVSCVSNRMLHKPTDHVVVEANPALLPLLQENRDRNDCHFTIVHAAVAHGVETIALNLSDNVLASSLQLKTNRAVVAPAVKLGDLLKDFGYERCTLLCDIEGSEVELVQHEIEIISERVVTIMMETHERLVGEKPTLAMIESLQNAGFDIAHRDGDVLVLVNGRLHGRR